ncbi:MAG: ABC transporter permease subunit [Actinomycetota bacterium]
MAREAVLPRGSMLGSVWARVLRDQRRTLAWWGAGFVLINLMYAAFWPSVRDNAGQFTAYIEQLPEFFRNMIGGINFATAEGYVQSETFSFVAPTMLLVYAIGAGARAIAGEEEAGSLDLLLSTPVPRRRVLLDKFGAMVVALVGLVALLWLSLAAFGPLFDLRPDAGGVAAMTLNLFLLALAFGSLALAVGAGTGSRTLAIGVPGGVAVMTYVLNALAPSVDWLEPIRLVLPFYHYSAGDPILNGLDPVHALVLAGASAVLLLYALLAFERRDLSA